jgi:pilus assembly protein CpaF
VIPDAVFAETLLHFFEPIRPFLEDPAVTDICVNGTAGVFVERAGQLEETRAGFESREALLCALRNLAQYVGKQVDADQPILEARLPDGARVEAVLPPAAPDGPHISIRKFPKRVLDVARLVEMDALTPLCAQALHALVRAKLNVLVAGGTGTGKTSMLNALSGFIPEAERVVVIEDSQEVRLLRRNVVQLEARPGDSKGRGEVTIRDLFRASLRMRPDRIVIGEIRGGESLDIVQAMTSGHGGCLTTLHATHPRDALTRLETMSMMSKVDIPLAAMRQQIASAVNIIVQVKRLRDGSRKISHVSEVLGFDASAGAYRLHDLFARRYRTAQPQGDATVHSELLCTCSSPRCLPELREHGVAWPVPASAEASPETSSEEGETL